MITIVTLMLSRNLLPPLVVRPSDSPIDLVAIRDWSYKSRA
jgi:hypothetical protein